MSTPWITMYCFTVKRTPSCHILLMTITVIVFHQALASSKGCSFKNDGCTYNIQLVHKDAPQAAKDCAKETQDVVLERAQNDYTTKIDHIEKNFSFLRDTHEQRLKELESTVHDLLGLDKSLLKKGDGAHLNVDLSSSVGALSLSNIDLMKKIEGEFNKLRDEVRTKSSQLIDTQVKLNETNTMMHEAQLKHFKSSQEVVKGENLITMLKRERSVLKNQLKDKAYRLRILGQKATGCASQSSDQQDKLVKLFRSEATLKEDLMTVQMQFNETKKAHKKMITKHKELKRQISGVRKIMRIRENELINCYSAKTNTFCDFEDPNICGFTNIGDTSDFFDWTRGTGRTPSAKTGPLRDHTCKGPHGNYMYIEASAKGRGSNAILYSPLYRGMEEQCVEFFYHMNGRHIGTLNVYAKTRGDAMESAWRAFGNQGDVWTNARLAIPKELAQAGYQLAFEGITESGYQGDMAIDDVSVTDGPCPVDAVVTQVKVPTNSTSVIKSGKSFSRKIRNRQRKKKKRRL